MPVKSEYLWVVTRHADFSELHRWFCCKPAAWLFFFNSVVVMELGSIISLAKILCIPGHLAVICYTLESASRQLFTRPLIFPHKAFGWCYWEPHRQRCQRIWLFYLEARQAEFTANPPSTIRRESELRHSQRLCRIPLATSSGKAGWYPESSTCFGRWALTPSMATCQLGAQDKSLQLSLLFCKIRIDNLDLILLCIAKREKRGKASGKEPAIEKELDWWYFPYHISFHLLPPGQMIEGQQNAFMFSQYSMNCLRAGYPR